MSSLKSYKTCLRYPGGKSRAVAKMDQYFPDLREYGEFREPFLGGGSGTLATGGTACSGNVTSRLH